MAEGALPQMTIDEACKEIDRLKALNASLRSTGKVNRETKNSVFLDLFKRKEYLVRLYRDLHPDDGDVSEDDLTVVTIENVFTIKNFNDLGFMVGGILGEYIRFSQVFDEQMANHKDAKDKAIQEIFRICIEEGILKGYLEAHRGEVEKIMMTMVSPEYIEKAEQKSAGIRNAIKAAKRFGGSDEDIKSYLITQFSLSPGYAQNWLDAVAEEEEDGVFA